MNKYSRDLQNIPRNFLTLSRSTDRVRFLNQKGHPHNAGYHGVDSYKIGVKVI